MVKRREDEGFFVCPVCFTRFPNADLKNKSITVCQNGHVPTRMVRVGRMFHDADYESVVLVLPERPIKRRSFGLLWDVFVDVVKFPFRWVFERWLRVHSPYDDVLDKRLMQEDVEEREKRKREHDEVKESKGCA